MKNIIYLSLVLVLTIGLINPAFAAFTDVYNSSEPSLVDSGGILDALFGLENLKRVDDNLDTVWSLDGDIANVSAVAKYAGYSQSFGYIDGNGVFTPILNVSSSGDIGTSASFTAIQSGDYFSFGDDPSGSSLFSSQASDNSDLKDHMVTWEIIGNSNGFVNNSIGNYIVAWEDFLNAGDQDYNDLVMEVKGVSPGSPAPAPEPMTMLLFGPALLGLIGLKRKK